MPAVMWRVVLRCRARGTKRKSSTEGLGVMGSERIWELLIESVKEAVDWMPIVWRPVVRAVRVVVMVK